jgi:hypothetical protein
MEKAIGCLYNKCSAEYSEAMMRPLRPILGRGQTLNQMWRDGFLRRREREPTARRWYHPPQLSRVTSLCGSKMLSGFSFLRSMFESRSRAPAIPILRRGIWMVDSEGFMGALNGWSSNLTNAMSPGITIPINRAACIAPTAISYPAQITAVSFVPSYSSSFILSPPT